MQLLTVFRSTDQKWRCSLDHAHQIAHRTEQTKCLILTHAVGHWDTMLQCLLFYCFSAQILGRSGRRAASGANLIAWLWQRLYVSVRGRAALQLAPVLWPKMWNFNNRLGVLFSFGKLNSSRRHACEMQSYGIAATILFSILSCSIAKTLIELIISHPNVRRQISEVAWRHIRQSKYPSRQKE